MQWARPAHSGRPPAGRAAAPFAQRYSKYRAVTVPDRARGVDIAARPVGRRAGPRLPAAPLPRAQLQALALAQTLPRPSCDHGPQARQGAAQRDPGTERDRAGWRP